MSNIFNINKVAKRANKFDSLPKKELLKNLVTFPVDYFLRNGKASKPLQVSWDVTMRCNFNCSFCFVKQKLNQKQDELNTRQALELVDKLAPFKPSFCFTGGEPLLRDDLPEIIKRIKEYGLKVGVTTNGSLLNKSNSKFFSDNLNYLTVSLGLNRKLHDRNRGGKGSYDKILNNLNNLKNRNCFLSVSTVLTSEAITQPISILDDCKSFAPDDVSFQHIICEENFDDAEASGMKGVVLNIKKKAVKESLPVSFKPNVDVEDVEQWYTLGFQKNGKCYNPWRSLKIGSNGNVFFCQMINKSAGNLLDCSFDDIWNGPEFIKFRRQIKKSLLPCCNRCCKIVI